MTCPLQKLASFVSGITYPLHETIAVKHPPLVLGRYFSTKMSLSTLERHASVPGRSKIEASESRQLIPKSNFCARKSEAFNSHQLIPKSNFCTRKIEDRSFQTTPTNSKVFCSRELEDRNLRITLTNSKVKLYGRNSHPGQPGNRSPLCNPRGQASYRPQGTTHDKPTGFPRNCRDGSETKKYKRVPARQSTVAPEPAT